MSTDLSNAGVNVEIVDDDDAGPRVDPDNGTIEIDQPDGSVVVHLDARRSGSGSADAEKHFTNLVDKIDDAKLRALAEDLFEDVTADQKSMETKLQDITRSLELLGLQLQPPRSDVGSSSSSVDGMSTVVNPLLLEACLTGWANSQAELLPAEGPCKVQDFDEALPPDLSELAEVYEESMNWYLTTGAPEYYPDTSGMLLWGTIFTGSGIKKIYRCPLRRRPVSDSVPIQNFIVSDATKDLRACERITHESKMRPSVLRRLKLLGEYADVQEQAPTPQLNPVDQKVASIQGINPQPQRRPENEEFTIWEIQCELDLDQFAPAKFKDKGIALPYRVTMDKDSHQVLSLRRDWNADDEECQRIRLYVKYPYIPGPGFFGTGLMNILGNASAAMTAAWRLALDAGMYANFPANLIDKAAARQLTNEFRASPGAQVPIDTGGKDIRTLVMGMPYKDVTPGLLALMDKITAQSKEAGGAAEIPVGEGTQNVPVGTMMASIEQATKLMAAAHKGMHTAQSEELQMIADLFRDNPEDFWRGNRKRKKFWNADKLLQALDEVELVPRSDPNIPSHLHRLMKAMGLVQLAATPTFGPITDKTEAYKRVLSAMREDPTGLIVPLPPAAPNPQQDAKLIEANAKLADAMTKKGKQQVDAATQLAKSQDKQSELATKKEIAQIDLVKEMVMHSDAVENDQQRLALETADHMLDRAKAQHDVTMDIHNAQAAREQQERDAIAAQNEPKPQA